MKISDAKRFLSPIRPLPTNHGSAVPIGSNENYFHNLDRVVITGITAQYVWPNDLKAHNQMCDKANPTRNICPRVTQGDGGGEQDYATLYFPVFDVTTLCSSWAPAVTSAMTISVSRWSQKFVNFSLQWVLDCDILGDSCIERTPLNAYQLFWKYHPPDSRSWDQPGFDNSERRALTDPPRSDFTMEHCKDTSCYPGLSNCAHYWALTGSCEPGDAETACPIYFLYNWRWIKSHLWEVGAVTSSIIVHQNIFAYQSEVYSSESSSEPIGMLDVTLIGWGQIVVNLSTYEDSYNQTKLRWWWVIPHFGIGWGTGLDYDSLSDFLYTGSSPPSTLTDRVYSGDYQYQGRGLTNNQASSNYYRITGTSDPYINKGSAGEYKIGLMKFNRRFDDCNIESHAVGAVPFNFVPLPHRTPEATWGED